MLEAIDITSGYAVVTLKKESIKGHVFLGLADADWKEWRVISENKEDLENYSKIKVSIDADFWHEKQNDPTSIAAHTHIKNIKTEIFDASKGWTELSVEKADEESVKELVKATLNHFVHSSTDNINNLLAVAKKPNRVSNSIAAS